MINLGTWDVNIFPGWTYRAMNIRDAVETDLEAIVEIYNAAIPGRIATGDIEPISVDSRRAWLHEHLHSSRPIWVMEVEGALAIQHPEIAGWLSFQSFYGRPAYKATAEISVYVAPAYRRCGVGRQLLSHATRCSPTLGLNTLLGFIFAHNQPSLKLFESMGFQRWGYLPKVAEIDGIKRDLAIVGRHINPADSI